MIDSGKSKELSEPTLSGATTVQFTNITSQDHQHDNELVEQVVQVLECVIGYIVKMIIMR